MKATIWLFFVSLISCTTTPPAKVEQCYCGPLISADNQQTCGLWDKQNSPTKRPSVLWSFAGDCTQQACNKAAADRCLKVEPWPFKVAKDTTRPVTEKPCYCDQVVIAKGSQTETVCAAWVPGESTLLEYFAIDDCTVESCRREPFEIAKDHCQLGFVSFYVNPESSDQEPVQEK